VSPVFVGVLRATLVVPGSRSLKDRRHAVRSVVERLRARFAVSAHELADTDHPGREDIVVTTAGNDRGAVDRVLASVRQFLELAPNSTVAGVDVEVFRWHPSWAPFDAVDDAASDDDSDEREA
jgi:uncharacterized protein YlxP (DUF503 family)